MHTNEPASDHGVGLKKLKNASPVDNQLLEYKIIRVHVA